MAVDELDYAQPELTKISDRMDQRYAYRRCDVGPGWYKIILDLDAQLNLIDPEYKVQQVKEKFGGLRYYAVPSDAYAMGNTKLRGSGLDDPFFVAIADAEKRASATCEECGEPGTIRTQRSWVRTLCDDDDAKAQAAYEKRKAELEATRKKWAKED